MNKPLYLLIGRSASGKTTIANILTSQYGLSQLQSYTTRPPRYNNEVGHIFISDTDFNNLSDIIAYTEYNGYKYCATKDQLDYADIYVVDVPGVETLLEKYQNDRPIIVIYFDASVYTRIIRMIDRGDCDAAIVSRLYTDEESDWERTLHNLVWNYKNNEKKDVEMYVVNADKSLDDVLKQVIILINNKGE